MILGEESMAQTISIGKQDFLYLRENNYFYIDNNLKKIGQDKTIGIIICKKDNNYIIEYCSDDRIIAREYALV